MSVPEDILLFSTRTSRAANDANNKKREEALATLLTPAAAPLFADPTHGQAWKKLRDQLRIAAQKIATRKQIPSYTALTIKKRGGRQFNWDFDFSYTTATGISTVKVEFKYGGTTVNELPEFFNPPANKEFHNILYADFFYDNYLARFAATYGITELPAKADYMRLIHQNAYKKLPFFQALYDAETAATPEVKKQAQKIVHESITAFLTTNSSNTNLANIQAEFQRSQEGKVFLLYDSGDFHIDSLKPEELQVTSVAEVRKGNVLVLQSAEPTTRHEMLLRWKNHNGILYPAWQISMRRGA